MTPAQLEHLRAIDAHLAKLLEDIAAKRTPGEWSESQHKTAVYSRHNRSEQIAYTGFPNADAAFIASCAGNAEAGWKATRAAIVDWLSLYNATEGYADGAPDASTHDKLCNEVASVCRINLQHILAAFPLELIQKP